MRDMAFRDGTRSVPDHVEAMILDANIETWKYTYAEAMDRANQHVIHERLGAAQRAMIREHFKVTP